MVELAAVTLFTFGVLGGTDSWRSPIYAHRHQKLRYVEGNKYAGYLYTHLGRFYIEQSDHRQLYVLRDATQHMVIGISIRTYDKGHRCDGPSMIVHTLNTEAHVFYIHGEISSYRKRITNNGRRVLYDVEIGHSTISRVVLRQHRIGWRVRGVAYRADGPEQIDVNALK